MGKQTSRSLFYVSTLMMAAWVLIMSCGGGGGGGGGGLTDVSINIGSKGELTLPAGEMWSRVYSVSYDVAGYGGPFESLTLNLQENLSGLHVTPLALPAGISALASTTATMYMRVARAEAASTVCTDGELHGPFTITINESAQATTVDPPTAEAGQATMDIINTGEYVFCVIIESPMPADVEVDRVDFGIAECGEIPADIHGAWTGSYECIDNCGGTGNIYDIDLTITQSSGDPAIASYTDDEADYEGSVCGNRFSFSGGGPGYSESGTFVLNPDGTATKTSSYKSDNGVCWGDCTDQLYRAD
jgi:hypothetical protein